MKGKRILMVFLIVCLAAITLGCAKKPAEASGAGSQQAAATTGDRELVVGMLMEPVIFTHMQPKGSSDIDMAFLYQIYDTLAYKNGDTGEVLPWLAKSWDLAPDGKSITLHLRDDVYFHDGSKMTAEDVAFTFNEQEAVQKARVGMNFERAEAVDEYTCVIYMFAPYGPVLNSLCSRGANIMSKAYYEKVGMQGYADHPIGTGPFKFVSRTSGDRIVLERDDNYWNGPAKFKKVTIQTISDINTMILALQSGDVDVVINAPVENLLFVSDPNVKWDSVASNASMFLFFNMLEKRWIQNNPNFRKAVQYAIDKDAINSAVFGGKATIIDILGPPSFTTRPVAGTYSTYTRDLEKAREYLAAANYKGEEFVVVCRAGTPEEKSAQVMQGTLHEVGINMKITAVDNATFADLTTQSGDYDASLVINTASVLDSDAYWLYFAKDRYAFPNLAYPRGPRLDQLVNQARNEPDAQKRLDIWTEVSTINNEDAYIVYILVDVNTLAYRSDLKNIKPHLAKYYRFWEWSY